MNAAADDHYAVLGVSEGVGVAELRRAWRRLALRWHPDRAGVSATATFQKISAAYAVLSNPAARAAYDRGRRARTHADATPRREAPGVLLRRLSGPLNSLLARGIARRAEPGVLDLVLTAQEIADGGMISISMRVDVHCPACSPDATAPCTRCGSKRTLDEPFTAWLAVPPGVAPGTLLIPSALLPGTLQPISFRVVTRATLRR